MLFLSFDRFVFAIQNTKMWRKKGDMIALASPETVEGGCKSSDLINICTGIKAHHEGTRGGLRVGL